MPKNEQPNEFKRKKKEEYYKYKQSVCSDTCEKYKSLNNDQWLTGTTVIVGDSILTVQWKKSYVDKGV